MPFSRPTYEEIKNNSEISPKWLSRVQWKVEGQSTRKHFIENFIKTFAKSPLSCPVVGERENSKNFSRNSAKRRSHLQCGIEGHEKGKQRISNFFENSAKTHLL